VSRVTTLFGPRVKSFSKSVTSHGRVTLTIQKSHGTSLVRIGSGFVVVKTQSTTSFRRDLDGGLTGSGRTLTVTASSGIVTGSGRAGSGRTWAGGRTGSGRTGIGRGLDNGRGISGLGLAGPPQSETIGVYMSVYVSSSFGCHSTDNQTQQEALRFLAPAL
jgi:hypothetical protein